LLVGNDCIYPLPSEDAKCFFAAIGCFAWKSKMSEYDSHNSPDGSLIVNEQHSQGDETS